jgi:phage gp29-like protein
MIAETLRRLAERYLPTRSVIVRDTRHDPQSEANLLDVDALHGILEEARAGNTQRLFAVYRDLILANAHAQAEFNTRKLAVVGEHPQFQPDDKTEPASVAAAKLVESIWYEYPGGRAAITHLLDAALWPVSLVEKTFRPADRGPARFVLRELAPVPYHLLDYTEGRLRIRDVSPQGHLLGTYHEPDPRRYIVHRGHLLSSIPDNYGGPMRAALFWWLFATMDRDWWVRFLERFGAPFIVGKYDPTDDGARALLRNAFSAATRLFGLTVSRDTEIEVHSVSAGQHSDAFEKFHDTAKRELSKLILGQTMTSEAQAGGLGGTQAQVHDAVRGDIRKFDALALSDTLRHQLFRQILDINGYAGVAAPSVSWGSDPVDAKALAETLKTLGDAGLRPAAEALPDLSLDLGFFVERVAAQAPPSMPGLFDAFAAAVSRGPSTGAQAADELAAAVARDLSATARRRIRQALAKSRSPEEFEALLDLPDEAELAARLLAANAANALSR